MAHPADKDGQPARSNPALQTLTLALLGTLVILLISPVSRPYLLCGLTGAEARVWHSTPLRPQNLSVLPQPDSLEDAALIMEVMAARMQTSDQKPSREELVTALEIAQAAAEQDKDNGYWWAAQAVLHIELGQRKESTESLNRERLCPDFRSYINLRKRGIVEQLSIATGRQMFRHALLVQSDTIPHIPNWRRPAAQSEAFDHNMKLQDRFYEAVPAAAFLTCFAASLMYVYMKVGLRYPRVALLTLLGALLGTVLAEIHFTRSSSDLFKTIEMSLLVVVGAALIAGLRMPEPTFIRSSTRLFVILTLMTFSVVLFRLADPETLAFIGARLGTDLKYLMVGCALPLNQVVVGGANVVKLFLRYLQILTLVMALIALSSTLILISTEPQRLQLASDLLSKGT